MRYLVYTRVSQRGSDWRGETSCEAQFGECRRWVVAQDPKAEFIEVREEFISGTSLKKRALAKILDDAKHGFAEWDVLVALDLDRLFRSTEECLSSFRVLADAKKGVVLVRQNIDMASPYGRFTLTVLAAVAQLVAQVGAQKTRDKMMHIARQGLWPAGKTPMGYKRGGPKDNRLHVDEKKAAVVRSMFADAADGHGPVWIARKHGIPKNTVMKVLSNAIYVGRVVYGDVDVEGKHDAIIDGDVFRAAQRSATIPQSRPDRAKYPYLLTGLIRCECGNAMSPATCRGKGGKRFPYYRCQNPACAGDYRYVRADLLENALMSEIARYSYSPGECEALARYESRHHAEKVASVSPEIKRLESLKRELERDVSALADHLTASQSSGMDGAAKAVLARMNEKQADLDDVDRQLEAARRSISASEQAMDPAKLAAMWRDTAMDFAAGLGDEALRRGWIKAHVVRLNRCGKQYAASISLQSAGCSTSRTLWHPQGAVVEIMFCPEYFAPIRNITRIAV